MSTASRLLLDTCACIWLSEGSALSGESLTAIGAAQEGDILVSPITAWEFGILVARRRLRSTILPEVWFASLLSTFGLRLAPMPPEVLIASTKLPGTPPRDPADRIIAATARAYDLTIVTRDRELLPYAAAGHVAVIRC